ncbi:programmed cell death protein 5-like isoform X2 [Amphibalanus amphitrite]|uniref:programmed cell death protein 5-like isoform X2 n=1 Tax=Amphibalanus amphitrite TaxID=1232801 RepID=UPI001C90856D|nr:programmed cell death protein 5-like isoform X2 [Amphibalanus amphitrite]XP_043198605.1 programmed cell death protein 5-like isoform X2 [Amphibalanus amphitrite]XP_043207999.1 programmed cell death protein 5-like isoform X2 [Amphibalanus amphitrite]XP_043208000.1 programmed cell death protein 5-like isoform X2 [Amphibalanus amphitrite]XP_043208001.1 programmed cell death protein 5-like isoform X2 [Amphibalanus amphitrite]
MEIDPSMLGAGGGNAAQNAEKQKEAMAKQEEMKNSMLSSLLDQKARARLNTILLAKPEKGAQLEGMLVNMARSGQIQQRLTEPELVGLLERVSDSTGNRATAKVKFDRRRAAMDSDDDEDYESLLG